MQSAVKLDGSKSDVLTELGYAYYKLEENTKAVNTLKKAIAKDSEASLARYYLGLTYVNQGDKESARKVYTELLPIDKDRAAKLKKKIDN